MITVIICFINCIIIMFGGEGFIKNYDMPFCCSVFEFIITGGVIGFVSVWKGE